MARKTTTKTTAKRHSAAPKAKAAAKATTPEVVPTTQSIETLPHVGVEALVAQLRHSDADLARDAATALGALAHIESVEPLMRVLENREGYFHPVVRAAAAASLGMLKDARAVDLLIAGVNDAHAEPSAEAIRALAMIGDARALQPLMEVVRNFNGYFLPIARRAAVLALGGFATAEVKALLQAVSQDQNEDAAIRDAAAQALLR